MFFRKQVESKKYKIKQIYYCYINYNKKKKLTIKLSLKRNRKWYYIKVYLIPL